jgi:hypothetical protein
MCILNLLHALQLLVGLHFNVGVNSFLAYKESVLAEPEQGLGPFYSQDKWLRPFVEDFEEELNEELYV